MTPPQSWGSSEEIRIPVGATLVVARVGQANAVDHTNTGDHKGRPYGAGYEPPAGRLADAMRGNAGGAWHNPVMFAGAIRGLEATFASPIEYSLRVGETALPLNARVGGGLRVSFAGQQECRHCGVETDRGFGGGFCYRCFRKLARCDLCIVAPTRCHHHLGTCREPDWGTANCMVPHVVYLADSGGLKVGLTRHADGIPRWLEQGARAGIVVGRAPTRRAAGEMEAAIAEVVPDKSDWRRQVMGHEAVESLADEAKRVGGLVGEDAARDCGATWEVREPVALRYPVQRPLRRPVRLRLRSDSPIVGRLIGIVGSFLLFDYGAWNVAEDVGCHVAIEEVDNVADKQGELF